MDEKIATPPPQNSTPVDQVNTYLARSNELVAQVDALQNPLAHAARLIEAGRPPDDIDKVLKDAQRQLATVEQKVKAFSRPDTPVQHDVSGVDLVAAYWPHVTRRVEQIPTGLADLDEILGGGLEPQTLVGLLGAPGGGKTTLSNQIGEFAARSGHPVFYVTSEDRPHALLSKTLARLGGIDYKAVRKGYKEEQARIDLAMQQYVESGSAERMRYLDASGEFDIDAVGELARAHFERYEKHGVLIVDYLQRLARALPGYRTMGMEIRQAVTILTESLRAVANELDCCVIVLAAQHRASGYGSNNALGSAKESGDIEYTVDVLMALVDDGDRPAPSQAMNAKLLRLDKNRLGPEGSIKLDWYGSRQQLTVADLDDDYGYQEPAPARGRGRR